MRDVVPGVLPQEPIEIIAAEVIENQFATERLRKRRQLSVLARCRTEYEDLLQRRLVPTRKNLLFLSALICDSD